MSSAPRCKIARIVDPTGAVSQSIDLVVKDRNLVGSRFDGKRDPTQDSDSPVQSMTYMQSQVGSLLEAISHTRDGITIKIDIYRGADDAEWMLEVVDEEGGSTVWDDTFKTDQAAFD